MDGEMRENNLKQNHLTEAWLLEELQKRDVKVKETVYAVLLGFDIFMWINIKTNISPYRYRMREAY